MDSLSHGGGQNCQWVWRLIRERLGQADGDAALRNLRAEQQRVPALLLCWYSGLVLYAIAVFFRSGTAWEGFCVSTASAWTRLRPFPLWLGSGAKRLAADAMLSQTYRLVHLQILKRHNKSLTKLLFLMHLFDYTFSRHRDKENFAAPVCQDITGCIIRGWCYNETNIVCKVPAVPLVSVYASSRNRRNISVAPTPTSATGVLWNNQGYFFLIVLYNHLKWHFWFPPNGFFRLTCTYTIHFAVQLSVASCSLLYAIVNILSCTWREPLSSFPLYLITHRTWKNLMEGHDQMLLSHTTCNRISAACLVPSVKCPSSHLPLPWKHEPESPGEVKVFFRTCLNNIPIHLQSSSVPPFPDKQRHVRVAAPVMASSVRDSDTHTERFCYVICCTFPPPFPPLILLPLKRFSECCLLAWRWRRLSA